MYRLVKLVTNTQGVSSEFISPFGTENLAKVNYHTSLAAYYNDAGTQYAVVEILDEYGKELQGFREVVDKRPAPEPTEE